MVFKDNCINFVSEWNIGMKTNLKYKTTFVYLQSLDLFTAFDFKTYKISKDIAHFFLDYFYQN